MDTMFLSYSFLNYKMMIIKNALPTWQSGSGYKMR